MDSIQKFDAISILIALAVLILTVYVSQIFITTVLFSLVMIFILKPFHNVIYKFTKNSNIASMISLLVVFLAVFTIFLAIASALAAEIMSPQISQDLSGISLSSISTDLKSWTEADLPPNIKPLSKFLDSMELKLESWVPPTLQLGMSKFISDLPVLFSQLLVVVFLTYYMLIDGKKFLSNATDFVPISRRPIMMHLLQELNSIYTSLFTVYFLTSMLSGVLAAIGFFILGVKYPFILGSLVAIATLVPLLGPPVVIIPLVIYYALAKNLMMSIMLLAFGLIFLMVIPENIIRPGLAKKSADINPILTVLAYTAPVFEVGPIGVIVGPALYGFLLGIYRTAVWSRERDKGHKS